MEFSFTYTLLEADGGLILIQFNVLSYLISTQAHVAMEPDARLPII
jgi:hypothetical protein